MKTKGTKAFKYRNVVGKKGKEDQLNTYHIPAEPL